MFKRKNGDNAINHMVFNIYEKFRAAQARAEAAAEKLATDVIPMTQKQNLVDVLDAAEKELQSAHKFIMDAKVWLNIVCQGDGRVPPLELTKTPYRSGCKNFGDSWVNWAVFHRPVDPAALEAYQETPGYAGPGGVYAKRAHVRTIGRRVLLTQHCGMDV
jgi:hypothetical protein